MSERARRDALALSLIAGVGATEHARRVQGAGSATNALRTFAERAVVDACASADALLARARELGALCALPGDAPYPPGLHALRALPPVIWMQGTPALAAQRGVAIVGTRTASPGGLRFARELAEACAGAGLCVVSGLARGIDGAAHLGALEARGSTVAVLGTGLDIPYPPQHRALQSRIAQEGLLLSEVSLGERGHAGTFPQRNRIIAALAEVTVVVEAGRESGALITARVAHELDRTVCAVPGSVHAPECIGSNALIQSGAQVICTPDDLLREFQIERERATPPALEGDAAACWHALQQGTTDVGALAVRAGLDIRRANIALAALELHGLLEIDAGGTVRPLVSVGVG